MYEENQKLDSLFLKYIQMCIRDRAYTKRLNTELGKKTAGAIVRYAEENHADVIVFEYLEMQGKIPGKKKQKLHLWRKRDIQRRCEHLAHRKEMRISRICAWNTSRLAYDGSGAVTRDWENHSLCTFQTGKRYHCDLSASCNICLLYTSTCTCKTYRCK